MNPEVIELFNQIRKMVSAMPDADTRLIYPQIPDSLLPVLQFNFKLADGEVPLYVHDSSLVGNLTQGTVLTDLGVHHVPDADNPLVMDWFSWNGITGVVITETTVTFVGSSNHVIPVSQIASDSLAKEVFAAHTLPIVIEPPALSDLDAYSVKSAIPYKSEKSSTWSGFLKLAMRTYSSYRSSSSKSGDRSSRKKVHSVSDAKSISDLFVLFEDIKKRPRPTYKSELQTVRSKVAALKQHGSFDEYMDVIHDFSVLFPHPSTSLWLAQEYMQANQPRHAVYCAVDGLGLVGSGSRFGLMPSELDELKSKLHNICQLAKDALK